LNKTDIEWVKNPDGSQGFTWNPITGCLNHVNGLCKGGGFPCYAFRLANGRLKQRYLFNANYSVYWPADKLRARDDPFYPRFWPDRLYDLGNFNNPDHRTSPRGIFVCDMGELFGDWIPQEWQEQIFEVIKAYPQHRFYLLTKQPQNLPQFSPFPDNCYVGVTATNQDMIEEAVHQLSLIQAKVKYLSIEPLLSHIEMRFELRFPREGEFANYAELIDGLIIGACTGSRKDMEALIVRYPQLKLMPHGNRWTAQPRIGDVREIIEAADKAGVKVFLKDNLKPLIDAYCLQPEKNLFYSETFPISRLRQEVPE